MAKGKKTGGRRPGSINRTTASVKAALVAAFDELGGVEALVKWGRKNPNLFYPLWARLAPTEVKVEGESRTVTEVIVRTREEASVVLALCAPPDAPVQPQPHPALPQAG
jgi:hypothetical protein